MSFELLVVYPRNKRQVIYPILNPPAIVLFIVF